MRWFLHEVYLVQVPLVFAQKFQKQMLTLLTTTTWRAQMGTLQNGTKVSIDAHRFPIVYIPSPHSAEIMFWLCWDGEPRKWTWPDACIAQPLFTPLQNHSHSQPPNPLGNGFPAPLRNADILLHITVCTMARQSNYHKPSSCNAKNLTKWLFKLLSTLILQKVINFFQQFHPENRLS